jgi:hypothetical protein
VSDAIDRHVKNFNFSPDTTNRLRESRVEHEAAHLILGLTFRHLRWNPTHMDFGYNGNEKAEALTIPIEGLLIPLDEEKPWPHTIYHSFLQDPASSFPNFLRSYHYHLNQGYQRELLNTFATVDLANTASEVTSLFEVRRDHQFKTFTERTGKGGLSHPHTRHGEKIQLSGMLTEDSVKKVFETLVPMVRLIQLRTLERAKAEGSAPTAAIMRKTLLCLRMNELEQALHTPTEAMDYVISCELGESPLQLGIKRLAEAQQKFLQASGLKLTVEEQRSITQRLQSVLEQASDPVKFLIARRVDTDALRDSLQSLRTAYRKGPLELGRRDARDAMNTESLKLLDVYVEKGFSGMLQSSEQRTRELYETRPHSRISDVQSAGPIRFWGGLGY